MVDVALRVLAWIFFVACVVEVFAAPFLVKKGCDPQKAWTAALRAAANALLAAVLWDYLR